MHKVARIFEDTGFAGPCYHVCSDHLNYLDATRQGYRTKSEAMRQASMQGFTHCIGSGTYQDGIHRIPIKFRFE